MNKKHMIIGEVFLLFSIVLFIALFFTDKVFKYMVLGFSFVNRSLGLVLLTGPLFVVPIFILLGIFLLVKWGFYRKGTGKFFIAVNYILSFAIVGLCIYGISLQSQYEKTIEYYESKENLIETLEQRLIDRNPNFTLEFMDVKVVEGSPIWQGIKGDDSFARTDFSIKVTPKNEMGSEMIKKYDYMHEGRQLQILIDCHSDGKCTIVPKPNGPIVY